MCTGIRSLHRVHPLYKYQAFELAVAVIFVTSPVTYGDILRNWEEKPKLPSGSLLVAFLETGLELAPSGSIAYSRGGCYLAQAQFTTPCTLGVLEEGMRQIWPLLEEWEGWTNFAPRHAPAKFRRIVKTVESCIHGAGSLKAQEVVQTLIRLDIIPLPVLADQAFINMGTKTKERIVDLLVTVGKYSKEDATAIAADEDKMSQFVTTATYWYDLTGEESENFVCKGLSARAESSTRNSVDCLMKDRSLWAYERKPGAKGQHRSNFNIHKIDPLNPMGPFEEYPMAEWKVLEPNTRVNENTPWCLCTQEVTNRKGALFVLQQSRKEHKKKVRTQFNKKKVVAEKKNRTSPDGLGKIQKILGHRVSWKKITWTLKGANMVRVYSMINRKRTRTRCINHVGCMLHVGTHIPKPIVWGRALFLNL